MAGAWGPISNYLQKCTIRVDFCIAIKTSIKASFRDNKLKRLFYFISNLKTEVEIL